MRKHFPAVLSLLRPFGINGHDNTLAAKHFSRFPHKVWSAYCSRIDRDLVGAGPEEFTNLVSGVNASSNRQRHKDTLCRTVDDINDDLAFFMRGGNVEKNQLIGTLLVVD